MDLKTGKPQPATPPHQWLDQYGNVLFRYAVSRLRDRDQAEDLVQETFLAAIRSRESFSGKSSEQTWLISILKHKMIDYFRKQSRTPEKPFEETDEPAGPNAFDSAGHWQNGPKSWRETPMDAFENREFRRILQECLTALPEKYRGVFVLREIEDTPGKNICKDIGITPSNLWVILHRARAQLRRCLEDNWFDEKSE